MDFEKMTSSDALVALEGYSAARQGKPVRHDMPRAWLDGYRLYMSARIGDRHATRAALATAPRILRGNNDNARNLVVAARESRY